MLLTFEITVVQFCTHELEFDILVVGITKTFTHSLFAYGSGRIPFIAVTGLVSRGNSTDLFPHRDVSKNSGVASFP